jgi:hypothetical protein
VQAAYRRNKAMSELEREGRTTAAIRNRARRRKAVEMYGIDDVTNLFRCCGVGLGFGDDYAAEDYKASREYQKEQYEEKKKAREEREAKLRSDFQKAQIAKKTTRGGVEEAYEIVE